MLNILKSKFKHFDPDTFDFYENNTYVVLVRYHETNELGFATVTVSEQEEFLEANSYHHLHKKKYTMDQFSVIKIADINYSFSGSRLHAPTDQFNDSWSLITSPVTKIDTSCWGLVLIKDLSYFGDDENKDHLLCTLAKISADLDDPLYGLYMTIYFNKKFINIPIHILFNSIIMNHIYYYLVIFIN